MLGIGEQHELPTVLLIDDDLVSREVIATLLTLAGYTVHTACGGKESLQMLETDTFTPEIILMDAQMAGLNGMRLIKALRKRSQASIYAISGSDVPARMKAATDGFLMKPFNPEALGALQKQRSPHPAVEESDLPVISPETLGQFRQLMPEPAVREIYVAIAADLKKRENALEAAIATGDAAEVRRIGHAIKGGCSMAGVAQAARIGARLENESNQLDNSAALLRDLRSATHDLESMLDKEFSA
jgi:CheY-like chemotaxis protein